MTTTAGRAEISLSQVNRQAAADPAAFMALCDGEYEKRVDAIARRIARDAGRVKLILLSGPSASGKTTTSLKIKQAIEETGRQAVTISMDDFFKQRELVPVDADGNRDFESLDALDLELLQDRLRRLIDEGSADMPSFDFKLGGPRPESRRVELPEGSVAVVEGLHALDPRVSANLPPECMLRLYVSVSSDFGEEDGSPVLTAREIRLVRRTIRDYHFRGSSPENTLDMWDSVCRGEDRYVRPFKKFADITVNSVFACEPCLFAETGIKLFGTVPEGSEHYPRARRLIEGLSAFERMPLDTVPGSCVLREFVGGSDYYNKSGKHREV